MKKAIMFSGIQPSGHLTIGNYVGALLPWKRLQYVWESIFCIVDLHAITVQQNPIRLQRSVLDTVAMYLAAGIDPDYARIFVQSDLPQHAQLAWILTCMTGVGELNRMVQFKEKREGEQSAATAGLFAYPVLMAADILLHRTEVVPVGADQTQHLELSRKLAERCNQRFGKLFVVPTPLFPKEGSRIMGLQTPEKKMSKSDTHGGNTLFLLDAPEVLKRKLQKAVTDSDEPALILYDPMRKAGVSNLLSMFASMKEVSVAELSAEYADKSYARLKSDLIDCVIATLQPLQEKFHRIRAEESYLRSVVKTSVFSLQERAEKQLQSVYQAVGLGGCI